jgi:predicted DNA-binding WGR domain protein
MKYEFIGWCRDEEANADKVWGVILLQQNVNGAQYEYQIQNKYVTFWGRRGKKLQTKTSVTDSYEMDKVIRSKTGKGYVKIAQTKLDEVYPEFKKDLEKTAVWAMLKP